MPPKEDESLVGGAREEEGDGILCHGVDRRAIDEDKGNQRKKRVTVSKVHQRVYKCQNETQHSAC